MYSQLAKTNHSCTLRTAAELHGKDGRQNHQFECFVSQSDKIFEMLFSIYIPTINADETRLNIRQLAIVSRLI